MALTVDGKVREVSKAVLFTAKHNECYFAQVMFHAFFYQIARF